MDRLEIKLLLFRLTFLPQFKHLAQIARKLVRFGQPLFSKINLKKFMHAEDLLKKVYSAITPARMMRAALVLTLMLFFTFGYIWLAAEVPPLGAYEKARLAMSGARHAEAEIYAPELLQRAELHWERAGELWQQESRKWRHQRRFRTATIATIRAARLADSAATVASARKDSLQLLAATGISLVREKIAALQEQFGKMPLRANVRERFIMGELAVIESELAYQRNDFVYAIARYRQAAAKVGSAGDEAAQMLHAYLANLPKWQKWVAETIAWSKQQKEPVIIVDKIAARSHIYKDGELLAEFPVELGARWVGHKKLRGDKATPEGRYQVIKLKERERTKYYKALEINYPNEEDVQHFRKAVARGELPRNAHPGGLIEIHGDGGKGINWTEGCVALRNDHMDEIYKLAKIGTPVTIVGSLHGLPALEQILSRARKPSHGNGVLNLNGTTHGK